MTSRPGELGANMMCADRRRPLIPFLLVLLLASGAESARARASAAQPIGGGLVLALTPTATASRTPANGTRTPVVPVTPNVPPTSEATAQRFESVAEGGGCAMATAAGSRSFAVLVGAVALCLACRRFRRRGG